MNTTFLIGLILVGTLSEVFLLVVFRQRYNAWFLFRYFLLEILAAIIFVFLYNKTGLGREFFIQIFFVGLLILISVIDYEYGIAPDFLTIGGVVSGLALSFIRPDFRFVEAFLGLIVDDRGIFILAFIYQAMTKREGIGGGAIKLLAMIGTFLGLKGVAFSLICGAIAGTLIGIPIMLVQSKRENQPQYALPFCPFLSASAILYLVLLQTVVLSSFFN